MSHFFGISHLVVFDLIKIDSLRELIGLAEGDHGDFVLAGHVGDHGGAHLGDDAAIAEDVAGADEDFGGTHDKCTDALDQCVDALDAPRAEAFDEAAARKGGAGVHHDDCDVIALLVRLHKETLEHEIDADNHYRVIALL